MSDSLDPDQARLKCTSIVDSLPIGRLVASALHAKSLQHSDTVSERESSMLVLVQVVEHPPEYV